MSWEPVLPYAILLHDMNGYKEVKSVFSYGSIFHNKRILRGTLLARLSSEEVVELKQHHSDNTTVFNFKVLLEATIKVYCSAIMVRMLNYKQKELLLGIESVAYRFDAVDKMEWAEKLVQGSNVYVTLRHLNTTGKGIVRFVGKLPDEPGIKFGVELLVCIQVKGFYV